MFEDTSVAPARSRLVGATPGCSRTRNPETRRPSRLGSGLLGECRLGRDRARAEAGHGGHDLEDTAGDIATLCRPWQQGQGTLVRLERSERILRGGRVRHGRGVVRRRRGEREDLARRRIEEHDGAPVVAQQAHGEALQSERQRQLEVLGIVWIGFELLQQVGDRVRTGHTRQDRVVGPFETRRAELTRGVPDDRTHRGRPVPPIRFAVLVTFVGGENGAVAIADHTPHDVPGRCDDGRVVGRLGQRRSLVHLPVARTRGQSGESEREGDPDPTDVRADGSSPGRGAVEDGSMGEGPPPSDHRAPRSTSRARRRPGGFGGAGGSTPLSDSARRSPTTTAFARSDEPP